jgi:acetyl-CoA decarbonylase/synthase, CODH/ACS complex subunit delta
MDYKAPVETYNGKVREIVIGTGDKAVKIGGENVLPFHFFEGKIDNAPKVALEINDVAPDNWADWLIEPVKDVMNDPVAWAKKCLGFGADLICIRLVGTDPAGKNKSAEEAAAVVKKLVDEVRCPLVVYGCGDEVKDIEVLTRVAEVCDGARLLMGPAVNENYEPIARAALDHGHNLIAQTPIDINLEKELNVKILKTFPAERIVIDPLSSPLGYGMEYSFTIMERTKQIGIMFGDTAMQMPVIADLGVEACKTKQARESREQGVLWESVTATSLVLAGANLLVMRYPESMKLIKDVIEAKF